MRSILVLALLLALRGVSRLFYRFERGWVGELRPEGWRDLRVIAILNHTSLYEVLMAGYADTPLLWRFARHAVLPVAEKTLKRRIGLFFRFLVAHVVEVTRQRDHTWAAVLNRIDHRAITIILPEGRMKRRNGLDSQGNPMTVRAGIADILEALDGGRMLLIYSAGLHHVQAPGEGLPKLFRTVRVNMEVVDIVDYKRSVDRMTAEEPELSFRRAVVRDLTDRRDANCPAPDVPLPRARLLRDHHGRAAFPQGHGARTT